MPYKNSDDKIRRDKRYYRTNAEHIKSREKENYHANKPEIRARRLELSSRHKEKNASRERKRYIALRREVINAYGNQCSCCGEKEYLFLEIDHVNNDGAEHRKIIGSSAKALLMWIKKNKFPTSMQILCANCNQGKKRNGDICPHKQ